MSDSEESWESQSHAWAGIEADRIGAFNEYFKDTDEGFKLVAGEAPTFGKNDLEKVFTAKEYTFAFTDWKPYKTYHRFMRNYPTVVKEDPKETPKETPEEDLKEDPKNSTAEVVFTDYTRIQYGDNVALNASYLNRNVKKYAKCKEDCKCCCHI